VVGRIYWYCVLLLQFRSNSSLILAQALIYLILFHCILPLYVTSYLKAVFTDPGTVPANWQVYFNSDAREEEEKKCKKSGLYKPPRAHYDSISGRLVLKMDHYCPWVGLFFFCSFW